MNSTADGVLPDAVSRDERADSWLVFVDINSPTVDIGGWLEQIATPAVQALTAPHGEAGPVAVCTVGFGASLFTKTGLANKMPVGLAQQLPAEVKPEGHDVVFYIFSTSDAAVATFLRAIASGSPLAGLCVERGYQRADKREVFGQLDGLRNVTQSDRSAVAFVGEEQPDEPSWSIGGSYMAYLKIQQNLPTWNGLTADEQAQAIGRNADGTRLDLTPGTDPQTEPPFTTTVVPPNAHIRKAGPRGANQDSVRIFRRGTPYIECAGNVLTEGLQFVSYQASVDDFLTILNRWMLNTEFPQPSAGRDALFDSRNLTEFLKAGLYFAVPHDDRWIGANLYDTYAPADTADLIIRLIVDNTEAQPDPLAPLEGATFQVVGNGAPLGTAVTNAAGHAKVPAMPVGVSLTVTQTAAPVGASVAAAAQTVTLQHCKNAPLNFVDVHTAPTDVYGQS